MTRISPGAAATGTQARRHLGNLMDAGGGALKRLVGLTGARAANFFGGGGKEWQIQRQPRNRLQSDERQIRGLRRSQGQQRRKEGLTRNRKSGQAGGAG